MTATFINSFILFFVTIDTIGNLPFFLSLTEEVKVKKRNQIAIRSVIVAFFIMIIFAYLGRYLLEAIGVSLDSLKIAGGIILMFLAIDILFEKRKKRRENGRRRGRAQILPAKTHSPNARRRRTILRRRAR